MGASLNSRGKSRRHRRQIAEINVTPMVDVMLVLLIIFMVAAPMLTAGVTVDLPESKAAALPGQDEPLTITIKADGTVYLQETEIDIETLGPKLQAITGEKTDTRIFVRGDTNIDYGRVMQVVGEINAAGLSRVALISVDIGSGQKGR